MQNPLDIPLQKLEATIKAIKPQLIDTMGDAALEFISDNFQKQGFQGPTFEPWAPRVNNKDQGRAILIKHAVMIRGFRKDNKTADGLDIANSVPYTQAHNEGIDKVVSVQEHGRNKLYSGKLSNVTTRKTATVKGVSVVSTVGAHTRHMKLKQRKMIGDSPKLENMVLIALAKEIIAHLPK